MFKKLLLGLLLISPFSALAHPHAFIDMQTKPLVKDNKLIGFSTQWLLDEASSSAVLYDVKQAKGDKAAQQKLVDEVMANVVNEHYFSYVFDKENHKIKYTKHPENYGMRVKGNEVEYYFDFLLAQPQSLQNNEFTLMTYDRSYMQYIAKERIILLHILQISKERSLILISMKKFNLTHHHWINRKKMKMILLAYCLRRK